MILAKSLGLDVQVKVQFKPIDSPSAESLATLNKLKADTDVALINAGVIDSQTANERVMNDPQSGYNADTAVDPLEQQLADLVKNAAAAASR